MTFPTHVGSSLAPRPNKVGILRPKPGHFVNSRKPIMKGRTHRSEFYLQSSGLMHMFSTYFKESMRTNWDPS